MSCYEQFSWSPEDVRKLPGKEAELLSVYFEELSAYQAKQLKKNKPHGDPQANGRSTEITEFELKDDDWDDDDYSEWLRLERMED